MTFFQQHHTIPKLEQQFQTQAAAMPQREKEKFLEYTKAAVTDLRTAANTSETNGNSPASPDRAGRKTLPSGRADRRNLCQKSLCRM